MNILGDKLRLIAQLVGQSKKVMGYAYITPTGEVNVTRMDQIIIRAEQGYISNAKFEGGKLVGTECQLSRLPIMDAQTHQIIGPNTLSILEVIKENGKTVQYTVIDGIGRMGKMPASMVMSLAERGQIANAKLVTKGGSKFISAIMGEFKQTNREIKLRKVENKQPNPELNDVKSKPAYESGKGFSRPMRSARYIGEITAGSKGTMVRQSVVDVYRLYLDVRSALNDLNGNNPNLTYADSIIQARVIREAVLRQRYWKTQISACRQGKVGKRMKSHYPTMFKAMEDAHISTRGLDAMINVICIPSIKEVDILADAWKYYDSARVRILVEQSTKYPGAGTEVLEREVKDYALWLQGSYKEVVSVLKIYEGFLSDYMSYKREALTKSMAKPLVQAIFSNVAARNYVMLNSKTHNVHTALVDAVEIASKGRIDGISQIMYVTALELAWMFNTAYNIELDQKKHYLQKKVGKIAELLASEPKKIESEKDYGAMLFQAIVIAMLA